MTRVIVRKLIWTEWSSNHIKKHNLNIEEVNNAISNIQTHKKGHSGRYILIGRSGKRIISIVIMYKRKFEYQVITARDSDKQERRKLYEKEKK